MEIRRSYDRLISTMGFPILVRRQLYIESGPCMASFRWCIVWSFVIVVLIFYYHYYHHHHHHNHHHHYHYYHSLIIIVVVSFIVIILFIQLLLSCIGPFYFFLGMDLDESASLWNTFKFKTHTPDGFDISRPSFWLLRSPTSFIAV